MILFALAFLLLLAFIADVKFGFLCALILFFAFFDMFDGFYKDDKIFAAIRYFIPLALLFIYTAKFKVILRRDFILLFVLLYLSVLWMSNAGDVMIATRALLSIFITLMMIPIGRYIGKRVDFIRRFEPYNRFLLMSLPLYVIAANFFHIGESYTDSFTTGFLITSRMYIVPIVVFLAIHYAISNKKKSSLIRLNDMAFIFINVCILLINTRRTALGMLAGAILVYVLLNRKLIFKMVVLVFVVIAALIASYPFYEARLTAQLERRERIQNMETYEEEGRYLETLYIIEYHSDHKNKMELLFGIKFFDTFQFGNKYFGRDRPIHSDINMIIFSTGLIGALLLVFLIFHYFINGIRSIPSFNKKVYFPLLIMFLMVLIPGRFVGTLTYAPFLMLLLSAIKSYRQLPYLIEFQEEETGGEEAENETETGIEIPEAVS